MHGIPDGGGLILDSQTRFLVCVLLDVPVLAATAAAAIWAFRQLVSHPHKALSPIPEGLRLD
jgi:hypothetical protein